MKTTFLSTLFLSLFFFCLPYAKAQHDKGGSNPNWFALEPRGGYGLGVALNKAAMDDESAGFSWLNPTWTTGARLSFMKGNNFGVGLDFGYTSLTQSFEVNINDFMLSKYMKKMDYRLIDWALLFRYHGDYGFIFETGPGLMLVNDLRDQVGSKPLGYSGPQLASNFAPVSWGWNLNLGVSIFRVSTIEFNFLTRLKFIFTDVFPGEGTPMDDGTFNSLIAHPDYSTYTPHTPTRFASAHLSLGLNYYFAVSGHASCGRGGRFVFFPRL